MIQLAMKNKACYYCGLPASAEDHVIPKIVLKSYQAVGMGMLDAIRGKRVLLVPACRECNSLLGASVQRTLTERKQELKARLKKKYKKLLKMPTWKETELKELSYTLRKTVEVALQEKELIKNRLSW